VQQAWQAISPEQFDLFLRQLDAPPTPSDRLQRTHDGTEALAALMDLAGAAAAGRSITALSALTVAIPALTTGFSSVH